MRAIQYQCYGEIAGLELSDVAISKPRAHEIQVRVERAALVCTRASTSSRRRPVGPSLRAWKRRRRSDGEGTASTSGGS
jgi:hypothetical protein